MAVHGRADKQTAGRRPKIIEALKFVRAYPHEIEADLAFRGVDILDWHRGDMSSRRLLVLLEGLPEDSLFRTAMRDGDWGLDAYVQAGILNELRLLRTDQAAVNGHKMEVSFIESPAQIERRQEAEREREAQRAGILAQLYGKDLGGTA